MTYPPDGRVYQCPWYDGIDLSQNWMEHGRTLKIFISGLREGRCELQIDDSLVEFEFEVTPSLFLGVWFNNFGFPHNGRQPFRCIAVEPCTSPTDVLESGGMYSHKALDPANHAEWSLRMRFAHNRSSSATEV